METRKCCAYNVTRSCKINSTVTVADSAREPLKVLKILVEGLARDSKSSLWLTPLEYAPQLTRLFPFDLAYLDKDMKVLVAMGLRPEVPAPAFHHGAASALILPFNSLQSSGTVPGDQIIVCDEDELELRLAEPSNPAIGESLGTVQDAPQASGRVPFTTVPNLPGHSFPNPLPQVSAATIATATPQGTGFTVAMTTSRWQISTSTMAAAVLEPDETQEPAKEKTGEIAVAETKQETKTPNVNVPLETTAAKSAPPTPAVEAKHAAGPPERANLATELNTRKDSNPSISPKPEPAAAAEAAIAKRKKPVTPPETTKPARAADPITTKVNWPEAKKKESLGVLVKRFLNCEDPLPERREIIRLLVQGLVAYSGHGTERKAHEVRDVSPKGLYLRTQQRWRPGEVVQLVLQRKDAREEEREKHVTVDLKAIRRDEGGVGFEWVWPEGVELEAWQRIHTKRSDETDVDFFLREVRLTRALAFLRQVCPAAMEELKLGLHKRLSNKRVASAVEITLKAQELLGQLKPKVKALKAHPDMVRRVLENGSWTEDDWVRLWWGGLLVSSCVADVPDTSNATFVDLLAKLMPVHLHLLDFVCTKATEMIAAGTAPGKLDVYCTPEELIEAVGSQSIARIHQTLGQLSTLALLAENNKPSYVAVTDKVKTRATPTALAMTMYARCNGRR